ncbi:MAG TPA: bifunctional 4-hydroxy-2-oxoglutarate aldolase/2-dehydro-3-deoxy-phosphogluconate aldolase [Candidatus Acidoferrum sp.]|nr:bifunctional 4-hydroxy-2-oxoglutarate aldolase/2-dehydro-3-deoxy-phosphogluconate aldolase [Candidatus Acidoferrum sp.]
MDKEQVRSKINEVGILPAIRVANAENARFAAETVAQAGIPIVEITTTIPGAVDVIADLARNLPHVIVGAGTILDAETARACLNAGAHFLTSPGLDPEIVQFARKENVLMMAGALTPTEIVAAYKAGSDFVKVFPCAQVGGDSYIKALKAPFPQIPLIAAGGVNQQTAGAFILAGASAVGVGGDLIPRSAIELRQPERIRELARRFLGLVRTARAQLAVWQAPARASVR